MIKFSRKIVMFMAALLLSLPVVALSPLSNEDMGAEAGQGLLVMDNIQGSNVTSGLGTGDWSGYTYTRMGLDVELSLNANIDKWQLGCGGFNEAIKANACDIDLDYVRLMGLDSSGTAPCSVSADATSSCYGGGDFVLTRPYIEIATKGSGATREVVGIKIGAQNTNGYFGIGRNYASGQTNLENGGTCGSGTAALNCHSGINELSGYMHTEVSAAVPLSGLVSGSICFGHYTASAATGYGGDCASSAPYYTDIIGTRVNTLSLSSVKLNLTNGLLNTFGVTSAYAQLSENLRFLHGFALNNTSDFSLSVQREKISYPGYDGTTYSYPANVGWWMNVPNVQAVNILGQPVNLSLSNAISALAAPGTPLTDLELNSVAPQNCWGTSKFC